MMNTLNIRSCALLFTLLLAACHGSHDGQGTQGRRATGTFTGPRAEAARMATERFSS